MKSMLLVISLLFVSGSAAFARETWEMCLDEGDFSFTADSFLKSVRVAKSVCTFKFTEIGGKGKKFEVNVCDPITKIRAFDSIEASNPTVLYAGSAGCEAPLFGADIDVTPGSGPEYKAARDQVYATFATLKKSFGKIEDQDLAKVKSLAHSKSEAKLACAQLLLDSYLQNCETFAAAPPPPPTAEQLKAQKEKEKNLPPGIHPSTIEP